MSTAWRAPIAVACAADAAYVRPLATMVQSVLDNRASAQDIDVYVLARGIPTLDRARLANAWARQQARAHWLDATDDQFAGVPLWGRMPVTTYYKLAIADLLPPHVDRVLWLDSDLIMLGDVGRLWATDLGAHLALAVQDRLVPFVSSPFGLRDWRALGLDRQAKYFNAGVMVIDVDGWRREQVAERVVEYLREHSQHVYFWDQEGLNAVLSGRWGDLDERWNCNVTIPGVFEAMLRTHRADSARSEGPWILHYSGNLKPWLFPSDDPHRRLFFEYLDRTPWAGWRPPPSLMGRLIDLYDGSGLRRIMYPAERLGMRAVRAMSRRVTPTNVPTAAG